MLQVGDRVEYVCPTCREDIPNGKHCFHDFDECATCFIESRVDAVLDQMDECEKQLPKEIYESERVSLYSPNRRFK